MQDDELGAQIEGIVQPVLRDHGLELVDIEWQPRRPRGILRVFVDKPGGVSIANCERVSRELGDLLDVADWMTHAYDLEVSSPGLERQLRTDREFRWARGRRVRCWVAGGQETRGRLVDADAARLVVETENGPVELPRAEVTKARLDAEVPWPKRANA